MKLIVMGLGIAAGFGAWVLVYSVFQGFYKKIRMEDNMFLNLISMLSSTMASAGAAIIVIKAFGY